MKLLKRFQGLLIITAIVIVINILSYYFPKEEVEKMIENAGILAPIVYIFLHLLTYIFAPLSGTSVTAIGFFLFGETVVIYSFVTVILSSITNFYIARRWGSYFAGLSKMKFLPYFLISVLATIPGTVIMYFLSSYAKSTMEYIIYSFLFVSLIFPIFILFKSMIFKKVSY
ncbi:MAG: hypothetical protein US75_C0018G0004 [Candidatus Woesebacteria bacterium GW2011_GWC1_38_13]|uniref:TVP38/TMEM64 family membrane protein n=1 Tax=Candidatus Woesebacteria bacterium GW2011_GWC1_38_13 TaxID=1618583 RepID=A0A0G0LSM5_9BACT|nr:MAG: hypothetical protein US75_C0018G0004 [Candidatus Woesebacteria bacterium GW2011_GWC1_38_13]